MISVDCDVDWDVFFVDDLIGIYIDWSVNCWMVL